MTDIRRHGFENDAQWREHLEEIDEEPIGLGSTDTSGQERRQWFAAQRDLSDLRIQIDALRDSIQARTQARRQVGVRWRLGAGALLLFLVTAATR